jgi:hypothetical protein
LHAKAALPKYHLAGYAPVKNAPPLKKKQTDEPPIGEPPAAPVTGAKPLPKFQPLPLGGSPRPLPPSVATPKTPTPPPQTEGPALFPK